MFAVAGKSVGQNLNPENILAYVSALVPGSVPESCQI